MSVHLSFRFLLSAGVLSLVVLMPSQAALVDQVKGLWDFDNGSLSATVGQPLVFAGAASATTTFGSTTSFGIPDIGGSPANVMHFPGYPIAADGIMVYPGIEANGGGSYVNRYTLLMDILFPPESDNRYRALFQTSSSNSNDADFYVGDGSVGPDPNGIGANFTYHGTLLPNTWYRIAFVMDSAAVPPVMDKYVNGTYVGTSELDTLDGTWTLYTATQGNPSWLFSDESGDTAEGYVNSIAILDGTASALNIQSLGGPSANGLFPVVATPTPGPTPTPVPTPTTVPPVCHTSGLWDFELGSLKATVGQDMVFVGSATDTTLFDTTTAFGIPDIDGSPAMVMHFPAYPTSGDGIQMFHGIAANGGGLYVNQYTLIMDVLFPASSDNIWRSLFQTNEVNSNDGDLYIGDGGTTPSPNGIGISGSYHGTILPDTWYRLAFSVDLTRSKVDKYIDGVYVGTTNLSGVDGRWSLYPAADNLPAWLFSDESGDTGEGYANSVTIVDCAMLPEDIAAVGKAKAEGIGIIKLRDQGPSSTNHWSLFK